MTANRFSNPGTSRMMPPMYSLGTPSSLSSPLGTTIELFHSSTPMPCARYSALVVGSGDTFSGQVLGGSSAGPAAAAVLSATSISYSRRSPMTYGTMSEPVPLVV